MRTVIPVNDIKKQLFTFGIHGTLQRFSAIFSSYYVKNRKSQGLVNFSFNG